MLHSVCFKEQQLPVSKIVCIGRNYHDHAKELNNPIPSEPVIFIKPNSSISDKLRTHHRDEVHYEAELCFLILDQQLAGIGLGLDLTKRRLQDRLKQQGLPWERSKAFDGAAVFSPFISCPPKLDELRIELHINKVLRQSGRVTDMIFSPAQLLHAIQDFMTLVDGDVLMSGTPSGVGIVKPGDHYQARLYQGERLLLEQNWPVEAA